MVFGIIDDVLEALQNAFLVLSGWIIDAIFPTAGVSGEIVLWLAVGFLAVLALL
ncbi:MAG: hypothetical protein V1811_00665 [Candidatus Micrarchaeota archaeon]